MLTFETPPETDNPYALTRDDIAKLLLERPGNWAIVARHDRAARATAMVERVMLGREYGEGFEATARRVGNEHRVYARRTADCGICDTSGHDDQDCPGTPQDAS
jgi:hypothetical protein